MQTNWTEAEENAVRVYWPEHGPHWDGWQEVLPTRSIGAIRTKASRIGVSEPPERKPRKKRKEAVRQYRHTYASTPDPYEGYVLNMMDRGMTPEQIDEKMKWYPGTARRILSERWAREK